MPASVQIAMLNKNNPPTSPFAKGGLGGITDKKGLTLIEVLIALLVTLVLFLALMQSALLSISSNTKNILRDEAVSIAEERMRELRGLPFTDADLVDTAGTPRIEPLIPRNFRNMPPYPFTPTVTVNDLDANTKQISVQIMWEYQENTLLNGNELYHTITSIKRRL